MVTVKIKKAKPKTKAALKVKKTPTLPVGTIIGWKKCYNPRGNGAGVVVKLAIPPTAKVNLCTGRLDDHRKCRASKARVLEIEGGLKRAVSGHDSNFIYEVGKIVEPTRPFDLTTDQCKSGIHFFLDKRDAKAWG
jgi:hypothetical protein